MAHMIPHKVRVVSSCMVGLENCQSAGIAQAKSRTVFLKPERAEAPPPHPLHVQAKLCLQFKRSIMSSSCLQKRKVARILLFVHGGGLRPPSPPNPHAFLNPAMLAKKGRASCHRHVFSKGRGSEGLKATTVTGMATPTRTIPVTDHIWQAE